MKSKNYKIKVEELPKSISISAKTSSWLFGSKKTLFEIIYYRQPQREEACDGHKPFNGPFFLEYDTEVKCEDLRDNRRRSYWYKENKFRISAINCGYSYSGIKNLDFVETLPIYEYIIERYGPVIHKLEEIVGKSLI